MSYQLFQLKQRRQVALNRLGELETEKEFNDIRRDETAATIDYLNDEIWKLEYAENPLPIIPVKMELV